MRQPVPDHRMLISFAHPDDESFGMGGSIAKYAQQGVAISLICATNGEVGTVDDTFMQGYDSIAALRLDELRCAAETLGIQNVITFGYRDSGMMGTPANDHPDCLWQADENVVTGKIVRVMREQRPQVVVTFDPFGGYGHPDHIYMHRATTRAFHAAGDASQFPEQLDEGLEPWQPHKLYYNVFPRTRLRLGILMTRLQGQDPTQLGKNKDINMLEIARQLKPTHARVLIAPYRAQGDAASGCHASQLGGIASNRVVDFVQQLIFRHQDFTRAHPAPHNGEHLEHDLFDNVP